MFYVLLIYYLSYLFVLSISHFYILNNKNIEAINDDVIQQTTSTTDITNYSLYQKVVSTENDLNLIITNRINKTIKTTIFNQVKYYSTTKPSDNEIIIRNLNVPNIDTTFKGFMDYRKITDDTTIQWEIQQSAYTDEYGLRKYNNDYCVALGSYYIENIGDRFEVTLDNGNVFTVIAADIKNDEHTDENNQYVPINYNMGNVIEFIVDDNIIHNGVWDLGDVSYYDKFSGNILEIKLLERNKEMS
jgi:hypothetical protein